MKEKRGLGTPIGINTQPNIQKGRAESAAGDGQKKNALSLTIIFGDLKCNYKYEILTKVKGEPHVFGSFS